MTEIQLWSREVAEDPGAPSFVPLARAYRRQGRRNAARNVVLRGLERNPEHVAAHALLALIRVEDGDRTAAGDEWETVLRLDPGNFEASRGLGFLALERGELDVARRHLDNAARTRPDDPVVAQARQVLTRRQRGVEAASAQRTARPALSSNGGREPARLFDSLRVDAPFMGALVLDEQGLVLAGSLDLGNGRGELLGALLNTAVEEARRTAELLGLGDWDGLLMDCAGATLHLSTVTDGAAVLVAARRDAPAGWVVRVATRARDLARSFLEDSP
jgi:tetratricopeptide (TPR) repeat protein